ncbi:hypothetical protein [Anabaena lutea]|uniref:Uncharacterized protein n=1 Tax=Anabaena lutea FACHB-196 TaxID=2692881 RepID=A0ABR8F900_9NOST|nr:hypothetical protein [Anabaena lutea]MBD2566419.1 hypothetical protein [Anabaena lutea FACHB-196]
MPQSCLQAPVTLPKLTGLDIDKVQDLDFGDLHRLWRGTQLLGTFYHSLDGSWVSQFINSNSTQRWVTDSEAINAIVTSEKA